jgi:hypothetical protein
VILVIDLDGRGVFLSDFDETHGHPLLVSANEIVGNIDEVIPAAASARLSRREMLFFDADDRPESTAPDAV